MPWMIMQGHPGCGADQWAVVKETDGSVEGCHDTQAAAEDQMAALYASEGASRGIALAPERRIVALDEIDARASGDKEKGIIVRGHAAVFDRMSLDLGGFRERIAPGAFKTALDANPDVHLLWDHDSSLVLARTRSSKYGLELREDPRGLHFYANVAPTSYAKDLALLMDSQVIDQASFAFTVARDEWEIDAEDRVTRTILAVEDLFDVTITAQGAYPQTDTAVVTHMRSRIASAIQAGRLPEGAERAIAASPPEEGEDMERPVAAEDRPGGDSSREAGEQERRAPEELRDLKAHTRTEVELAKRRLMAARPDEEG